MVDRIHFPRTVGPLFPAGKVRKVKRRQEDHRESGFKKDLDREKSESEAEEEEDGYVPADQDRQSAPPGGSDRNDPSSAASGNAQGDQHAGGPKIDVHA